VSAAHRAPPPTTHAQELLFFGAQATLGSAEINLFFRGERFGTLSSRPCPLGGGGKIRTQMAGQLVVDDVAVFKKIARAVVHEDEFTVELYAVILGSHSRDG